MQGASIHSSDKATRYRELVDSVRAVTDGESDLVANLANTAALLHDAIVQASWCGFYIRRGDELVLGPFWGKVACVRIALSRGVCGACATQKTTIVVDDVDAFPGHIACDAGSKSEVVVPVIVDRKVVAVIDVDSYAPSAFDQVDASGLEALAAVCATWSW